MLISVDKSRIITNTRIVAAAACKHGIHELYDAIEAEILSS